MKKILCFSAGIDSFVAWYFLRKPQTVFFDCGSRYSEKEKEVVLKLIPNTIIDRTLDFSDKEIGEKAYVPYRNLMFAIQAAKYGDEIYIAGLKDDMVSDKTPEAFTSIEKTMNLIEKNQVTLSSPFWGMTKSEVIHWFLIHYPDEKNELLKTVSCYHPSKKYCGACPSCFRKFVALYVNGIVLDWCNINLALEYYTNALNGKYDSQRNQDIITVIKDTQLC